MLQYVQTLVAITGYCTLHTHHKGGEKMFVVVDYTFVPAEESRMVQRIKGGQIPPGAIAGGNGTFIIKGRPAMAILHFENKVDGAKTDNDIAPVLRSIAAQNNTKLTEKRIHTICQPLIGTEHESDYISHSTLEKMWDELI
jgi:hypothetical protein